MSEETKKQTTEPSHQIRAEGFLRRSFRNDGGDWKKTEALLKEAITYAEVIEGLANDLITADVKLKELLLAAYKTAPIVEGLYMDCPVSPNWQITHLRLYLKKLGWAGVRDVITPTVSIEPFSKQIKDAAKWLLKFKDVKN